MKKFTYGGRVTNTKNSDCENCGQEMNMIYKKGNKYLCRKCNSMNFDCCDCKAERENYNVRYCSECYKKKECRQEDKIASLNNNNQ